MSEYDELVTKAVYVLEREGFIAEAEAVEALQAEVERLKGVLQQIGEGIRDGQHCALIANITLEAKP